MLWYKDSQTVIYDCLHLWHKHVLGKDRQSSTKMMIATHGRVWPKTLNRQILTEMADRIIKWRQKITTVRHKIRTVTHVLESEVSNLERRTRRAHSDKCARQLTEWSLCDECGRARTPAIVEDYGQNMVSNDEATEWRIATHLAKDNEIDKKITFLHVGSNNSE